MNRIGVYKISIKYQKKMSILLLLSEACKEKLGKSIEV
jgi:hypothetical protein